MGEAKKFEAAFQLSTAAELFNRAEQHGIKVSDIIWANERSWLTDDQIRARAMNIWKVMDQCIERALQTEGTLPGGLGVTRRAAKLRRMMLRGGTNVTGAE